jgi:hypothetical protein
MNLMGMKNLFKWLWEQIKVAITLKNEIRA